MSQNPAFFNGFLDAGARDSLRSIEGAKKLSRLAALPSCARRGRTNEKLRVTSRGKGRAWSSLVPSYSGGDAEEIADSSAVNTRFAGSVSGVVPRADLDRGCIRQASVADRSASAARDTEVYVSAA